LEDTLKAFIQESSQNIQELQSVTMSNSRSIQELSNETKDSIQFAHQAIVKMEGEIDYLVAKFHRIKEGGFHSELMASGHYMIVDDDASNSCHELFIATIILESEEIVDNNENKEKDEQVGHIEQVQHTEPVEPPVDSSLSNDKEVSIEAHSFIIVPLETHHEPKASVLQVLKEQSYAKILKDLCTQARKSVNRRPKKIFRSK
jgi:hypothetical protein